MSLRTETIVSYFKVYKYSIVYKALINQRLAIESSELSSSGVFCFYKILPAIVLSTPAPLSSKAAETTGNVLSVSEAILFTLFCWDNRVVVEP